MGKSDPGTAPRGHFWVFTLLHCYSGHDGCVFGEERRSVKLAPDSVLGFKCSNSPRGLVDWSPPLETLCIFWIMKTIKTSRRFKGPAFVKSFSRNFSWKEKHNSTIILGKIETEFGDRFSILLLQYKIKNVILFARSLQLYILLGCFFSLTTMLTKHYIVC